MRFRKSVNICKGVKLNLSKSGVSCTVGGKGLSLNLGKNGLFLNTGIPGTGLYDRKKIAGGLERREERADARDYLVNLGEDGAIELSRRDGRAMSEEEERRVRRADWYKRESGQLMERFRDAVEAERAAFVDLYRRSCSVEKGASPELAAQVEDKIDAWLQDLELPMRFDVQYDCDSRGLVMLDIDLPEIEDLPEDKVVQLSGGCLRAKPKSQRELREEYRTCAFGLAVFLVSHVFSLSSGIRGVLASGYTQRRGKRTGEREDVYIFSIAFPREAFESDRCRREDPFEFCDGLRGRLNLLSSGELKQIVPYTAEEFAEMMG